MQRCARASPHLPRPRLWALTRSRHHRAYAAVAEQLSIPERRAPPQIAPQNALPRRVDPFSILAPELNHLRKTLLSLLGTSHPALNQIAEYYFLHPSKQIRPLLVLLFSRATNGLGANWGLHQWRAQCEGARGRTEELNAPLTRSDVLNDWNPSMPDHTSSFSEVFPLINPSPPSPIPQPPAYVKSLPSALDPAQSILPTQSRLSQIVEMIHVASLLHDDVIDKSPLRRGAPSAPEAFGNKVSVLGGDFLLGRASSALSRLGSHEATELIAGVISNLVEGEILQMRNMQETAPTPADGERPRAVLQAHWNIYMKKTYLKTASLMAKGSRAAVVLGGCREGEIWKEVAYAYGRNLGLAFQVSVVVGQASPIIPEFGSGSWSTTSWITRPRSRLWASQVGLI
jgi:hexaprenyl-diphosphate synthase